MLAAERASTIAKPSMIFARNRKVGSFDDINCGCACLDNPTSNKIYHELGYRRFADWEHHRFTRAQ